MSALTDTQSERDDRQLPIDRVGVRNLCSTPWPPCPSLSIYLINTKALT